MIRAQDIADHSAETTNLEQFIQNELRNSYPAIQKQDTEKSEPQQSEGQGTISRCPSDVHQLIRTRRDLFWEDAGDFLRHRFSIGDMAISSLPAEGEIVTDVKIRSAIRLRLARILQCERFLRTVEVVREERFDGKYRTRRGYRDETEAFDRILRTAYADWDQLDPATRIRRKDLYRREKGYGQRWLLMAKNYLLGALYCADGDWQTQRSST